MSKQSKNKNREQARLMAQQARALQERKEKKKLLVIQASVIIAVLGVIALVLFLLFSNGRPGDNPRNMSSGGATFTKDFKVVETPAIPVGGQRVAEKPATNAKPVHVRVYEDFMCPACGLFEQENGEMLEQYVKSGDVNLEIYPVNFLDAQSAGTKYSTRAANAFACVVDEQPDVAFKFHANLFSAQPREGSAGLTDKQLMEQAKAAGAKETDSLTACIRDRQFGKFVEANYKSVSSTDGVLGLNDSPRLTDKKITTMLEKDGKYLLQSTPLVIVNGEEWSKRVDGALDTYIQKKMQGN